LISSSSNNVEIPSGTSGNVVQTLLKVAGEFVIDKGEVRDKGIDKQFAV
jgi:hypothetical protein